MTMTEAARRLHVSVVKIRALVREGLLPARENPLDRREKLIPAAAVQQLERQGAHSEHALPRSIGMIADPDFQSADAETYMAAHRQR